MTTQAEFWPDTGPTPSDTPTCEPSRVRLWPTPNGQEPGWKNLVPSDRNGNTPTHASQRWYDAKTGRLLQKGIEQVARFSPPSISCAAAFLARISAWRVGALALRALALGCGQSSLDSLASLGRDGLWLKTSAGFYQLTLGGDSELFSETWPRSGTVRGGIAYRLPASAPLTDVIASLLSPTVPTPTQSDGMGGPGNGGRDGGLNLRTHAAMWPTPDASVMQLGERPERLKVTAKNGNGCGTPLAMAVQLHPTPTSRDWKSGNASPETMARNSRPLSETVTGGKGGQLSPEWVELLMGFPPGWTELPPDA